jgi:phosphate transport system substrate-binding protein
MRIAQTFIVTLLVVMGLGLAACGGGTSAGAAEKSASGQLIAVDGSSTVFPITEAMAEEFQRRNPNSRIAVGISGTGGGFKKFCNNETDMTNASRQIRDTEKAECEKNKVEYVELEVAFDGLSMVANPQNTWAQCLTTAELKKIWEPESKVNNWKDVRAGFPDVPIKLYGPGTDSGTFDYFTEAINGKEKASRSDFQASEDDNVLVQGVAGDKGALGYFGYAYYEENKNKLKLIAVDGGHGCVEPTTETVEKGTYKPLSRPLYVYVKKSALARPEVRAFVNYYLGVEGRKLVPQVGYITLPTAKYEEALKKIADVK